MAVTRDGSMGTPVDQGLLSRITQGVKYIISGKGPNAWMGPGQPVAPMAQEDAKGRAFDYPVMVNTQQQPRNTEGTTYQQLRNLADGYDLLRLVIETRKDQMSKLPFTFGLKKRDAEMKKAKDAQAKALKQQKEAEAEAAKPPEEPPVPDENGMLPPPKKEPPKVTVPELPEEDPRVTELEAFFAFPDQEHDWDTWLRMLLEEMFVTDATTLYPRENLAGGLYGLELIDGATITRKLDESGRTPEPPDVAYQQVIKGIPAVNYHRDELIYRPRNVRVHKIYGYSPVEQIIMTVNIALRRQISQLQYYTEGNVPEAMIGVPPEWTSGMIREFQEYWDSLMEGNTAAKRHAKFVPGGMTPTFTREPTLKDVFDEWLARIVCYAFSLSPQALIKETNRSVAESMHDAAVAEGLAPIMKWIKSLIDYIIWKWFGYTDLEFKWVEEDEVAPKDQAEILTKYVEKKIMEDDEARGKLGMDPFTPEQRDRMRAATPAPLAFGGPGGGGGPPPGAKGPQNPDQGGAGKPMGKLQGSGLRKVKSLSRNRASNKASVSSVLRAVTPALAAVQKQVLKELRAEIGKAKGPVARAKKIIDGLDMDDFDAAQKNMVKALQNMFADGGKAGLNQVISEITPESLKQVNTKAVEYANERAAELVTSIKESTRDMLRATVVEALENGWSNDELAKAIEESYAFSPERAETIARTETAYADVAGNLEGWSASGVVARKKWIVAQDEYCDICEEMNNVEVDLHDQFPGDGGDGPPLHPNCRCDVVPIVD